jgi:hypothetical protein
MPLASRAALATLAAGLSLALPGLAHADTYCVNAVGCAGTAEPDLQTALTAAQNTTAVSDTVEVGDPGPGTGGYAYSDGGNSANEVNVVGAGTSQTLLTRTGTGRVVSLDGEGSNLSHVTVQLPAVGSSTGVFTKGSVTDVNVTTLDTSNIQEGASLDGTGDQSWVGGSILLPGDPGGDHMGVVLGNPTGLTTFQDMTIEATDASIQSDVGERTALRRVRLASSTGLEGAGDSFALDNVTYHALGAPGWFVVTQAFNGHDATVTGNHVSAFGGVSGSTAFRVTSTSPGLTTTVDMRNSIIHGFDNKLTRVASGGGIANINLSYDDTDSAAAVQDDHTPGNGSTTDGPGNINGDPLWTNAAAGDFTLGAGSPAIDKGDPAGLLPGESATDVLGAPRISNGRQDMGAVEVQVPPPPPPVVKDTTPPKIKLSKLPKTLKFKRLLAGLTFTVRPNEPSAISATLAGAASTVKLAKSYNVTLAHKSLRRAAGARRVTLKVRKKLLGKSRRFTLKLTVVATDASGNKKTLTRTIKVRR